jgi:hypothetical protein
MHELDLAMRLRRLALAGERIEAADALALHRPDTLLDLLALGRDLRLRRFGRRIGLAEADHPTGFAGACPFCDFVEPSGAGSSGEPVPRGDLPFHAASGVDASRGLAHVEAELHSLAEGAGRLVHALTIRAAAAAARVDSVAPSKAFERLRRAGVERLGGGAPVDPSSSEAASVLAWHRDAHRAGLTTDLAVGYPATGLAAFATALDSIRSDRGFTAVVPVPDAPDSTGFADLGAIAIARLLLDGKARVGVSFAALGDKLAPVALGCGGDFLAAFASRRPAPSPTAPPDATLPGAPIAELRRLVCEADLELVVGPIEADALAAG